VFEFADDIPPQTIISVPVHMAVCQARPAGPPGPGDVWTHESEDGEYRAPVLVGLKYLPDSPPQMIISEPVHMAV